MTGLSHDDNLKKMRILTIMNIGISKHEVSFEELAQQLDLGVDDIEEFIIEGMYSSSHHSNILVTIATLLSP